MRLLLDQGLPRSTVNHLDAAGVESAHVGEKGLAAASKRREDSRLCTLGRLDRCDFGCRLPCSVGALWGDWPICRSHSDGRSAGRGACHFTPWRAEGLQGRSGPRSYALGDSVTENGARIRRLPLLR
jgi:hypothetical protein